MAKKKYKNPKGGLTAAGRAFYKRTEGANLKPGVKNYSKASDADKKRWVRWALRFAGRSDVPPLKKPNGEPTRFALMFAAWGEPVPTTVEAVRKVYKKAQSRRDQLGMGKAAKSKSAAVSMSDSQPDTEVLTMETEVNESSEVEEAAEFASEKSLAEIHLSGDDYQEQDGFVVKEILRTGEWGVIPTKSGLVDKPLRVVKDGISDSKEGIISLSEIVENFNLGAIPNVQIPLSDDSDDHKNITRLNTGYVRDIWISEDENGEAKLVAKMEFTEPDVKEKVLRGTYSDVSCGIPWSIVSRGKKYGASLEHVAITNRPFIDGLGPFLAASDNVEEEVEVTHFSMETAVADAVAEVSAEQAPTIPTDGAADFDIEKLDQAPVSDAAIADVEAELDALEESVIEAEQNSDGEESLFSTNELASLGSEALTSQLNLPDGYEITDVLYADGEQIFTVRNSIAETSWQVPFQIASDGTSHGVLMAAVEDWIAVAEEEAQAPVENSAAPRQVAPMSDLEAAQHLREIRLSDVPEITNEEDNLSTLHGEELDRLDLSDEQRAAFQSILDENAALAAKTREADADARISELEEMGLKERPGFLKLYREVMLSDDGGPAVVVFSDGSEEKEKLTAVEILDRALEALKDDEGQVALSDQALVSGNDNPPPADASEEVALDDRVSEVKKALGL